MEELSSERDKIASIINSSTYRYFNDDDNGFVQNGIDAESAVSVLVETAMTKLQGFDALVLIHPDYLRTTRRQMYKKTIESVVKQCLDKGKPVFCLPFGEGDSGFDPFIFKETIPLPDMSSDDPTLESIQTEVSYVANVLGKKPEEIRLAWGGMLADLCVAQWRDAYCLDTLPPAKEGLTRHEGRQLDNPISYGETLPELISF